ncbi:MAG: hypothetical protein DCC58_20590, partial [Chloroflexi bacterium]
MLLLAFTVLTSPLVVAAEPAPAQSQATALTPEIDKAADAVTGELVVRFRSDVPTQDRDAALRGVGAQELQQVPQLDV